MMDYTVPQKSIGLSAISDKQEGGLKTWVE